jgi:hypothetical protein
MFDLAHLVPLMKHKKEIDLCPLFPEVLPQVGTVLPLAEARIADNMLAGARHAQGKIVLSVAAHEPT